MNNIEAGQLVCKVLTFTHTKDLQILLSCIDADSWDTIYTLIKSYNLEPLFYSKLYKNKLLSYLPDKFTDLKIQYNKSARECLKREYEVKKVLQVLTQNNIEVILLKGIYLSSVYYENPAERPMSDIDLLIKIEDLKRTVEFLLAANCYFTQNFNIDEFFESHDLKNLKTFTKHLPELITPNGHVIEIHWTLEYGDSSIKPNLNIDEIWETKVPFNFNGIECFIVKAELMLLYLCVNIVEDRLKQKILQLYDIFIIITGTEINWKLLLEKANSWNCCKEIFCILQVERKTFNLNISGSVLSRLSDKDLHIDELEELVFADLTIGKQYEDKIASEFSTKNFKDKLKLFYWTFWSKEKINYHYGINKGFFKIFYFRVKRTSYLLSKYLNSFIELYFITPDKRRNIKNRENLNSLNNFEEWLSSDKNKKKVAIIHYWLDDYRGGEKVVEALCEVFPQADIYTHMYKPDKLSDSITKHKIYTTFISKLPFADKFYRHYLLLMPLALKVLNLKKYDLIISSESGPAKGIRKHKNAVHICYCHSPMRYIWDMRKEYVSNKLLVIRILWQITSCIMRQWDRKSAQSVDYFIANSKFIASRIRKYYKRKSEIIYPPVDIERFNPNIARKEFYLCACQLTPYKKVELLVEAFNYLQLPLEIIGKGSELKKLKSIANNNITFLGKVSDDELKNKMETCKAFVYACKEDFGIVIAEANAAGTPALAFRKGGAKDIIVNNKTGILFKEQTIESIINAVNTFNNHTTSFLSHDRIADNVKNFSKDVFIQNIYDFLIKKDLI